MDTNYLEVFFRYLGISFFILGLILNYGGQYLPEILLQFVRYGRANISKGKERPSILKKIEVPKSWFGHFYLFTVISQCFIVFAILNTYGIINVGSELAKSIFAWVGDVLNLVGGDSRVESVNATTTVLTTSLFLIHISRRLYETWFVSVYSNTKMNISHYLLAFVHYSGSMLSLISQSPGFTSKNSTPKDFMMQIKDLSLWSLIGIVLFIYGTVEQNRAHRGFANLRKGKGKKISSLTHQIPKGGLFELISCPNYWAEIILYISFMVMFGFQNVAWNAVTLWVIANQITSGVMNHLWYFKTFPNYPRDRKAIIPFIW